VFVLREHLPQVFHPGRGEGGGLLVVGVIDPEAAVLRLHVRGHGWSRHASQRRACGVELASHTCTLLGTGIIGAAQPLQGS
jgi:hypothetical protein